MSNGRSLRVILPACAQMRGGGLIRLLWPGCESSAHLLAHCLAVGGLDTSPARSASVTE
jgi:hypothetical protein